MTRLHQGHAEGIAPDLAASAEREHDSEWAETLRTNAGYIRKNRDRMQYPDHPIEAWAIGSGMNGSQRNPT